MDVHPSWGREQTLGQIIDQAGLSAVSSISKGIEPMIRAGSTRLVSKPEMVAAMIRAGSTRLVSKPEMVAAMVPIGTKV